MSIQSQLFDDGNFLRLVNAISEDRNLISRVHTKLRSDIEFHHIVAEINVSSKVSEDEAQYEKA